MLWVMAWIVQIEALSTVHRTQGLSVSTKLVFVGGKGGVGKTSTASAIGLQLAEKDEKVLLVSTDPAHSLCDALGVDGAEFEKPRKVFDDLELYAMEVDADAAMDNWRNALAALDLDTIGERYGSLGAEALKSIGLEELKELASAPPPGVDEVVALARVFQYRKDFDRVIVDTAPTGHALRLLELPTFAESFLAKLTKLKDAAKAVANLAGGFLGGGATTVVDDLELALSKIDSLRISVASVRDTLKDGKECEFVAVAIPTTLSFLETQRLLGSLKSDLAISCHALVVNKVIFGDSPEMAEGIAKQQTSCLAELQEATDLPVVTVPFIDSAELVGPEALRYLGSTAPDLAQDLLADEKKTFAARLIVVGGKGGVGKSTTAGTIAVAAADKGLRTCVVSTDPAHSLGDALGMDVPGGQRTFVQENLEMLEIDADAAAQEASELLRDTILSRLTESDGSQGLAQLAEALETPPPGVDELVALLKVLNLLRDPDLDLVVLDTAPTGHTLRMLALPELLDDFAERAILARNKLKRNPLVKAALNAAGIALPQAKKEVDFSYKPDGGPVVTEEDDDELNENDRLRDLQDRAFALDAVLHDPGRTSFVLVAAPTDLSVAETKRLDQQLQDQDIPRSKLVVNGLVDTDSGLDNFAEHLRATQTTALGNLQTLADDFNLRITLVPQFSNKLSGRFGLLALSNALFDDADNR